MSPTSGSFPRAGYLNRQNKWQNRYIYPGELTPTSACAPRNSNGHFRKLTSSPPAKKRFSHASQIVPARHPAPQGSYHRGVSTLALAAGWSAHLRAEGADDSHDRARGQTFDQRVRDNAIDAFKQGRHTFRFDTFGDEDFWGGELQLHRAIAGAKFGGVGPGISPATALSLGLKVDVD